MTFSACFLVTMTWLSWVLDDILTPGGVAILLFVVGLPIVIWVARRHERARMRRGEWDEHGPLIESDPPPGSWRGGRMQWRLEVIGAWRGIRRWRQKPAVKREARARFTGKDVDDG